MDKKLVGPALGDVTERREADWLNAWIKDNAALRASGDADAIAIFNEYNGSAMSAFPSLTDKNIEDILYYTKVGDPKKAVAVAPVGAGHLTVRMGLGQCRGVQARRYKLPHSAAI